MHSTGDSNTKTLENVLENIHSPDVNTPSSSKDVTGIYGCFSLAHHYTIFCQGGSNKITETPPKMTKGSKVSSSEDSNTETIVYVLEDNYNPDDNTSSFSENAIGIHIVTTILS